MEKSATSNGGVSLMMNGGDVDGGGGVGPTGSNSGGANEVKFVVDHNTLRDDHHLSSSAMSNNNIFASYYHTTPYSSPEIMVTFTSAQWKELEKQAMIYKYMISSVPVPPHLLYSLYNNDNNSNVGYSKDGAGRCKRTDGKKWRCSRDVAPHQKYCERHLHRGRPRSRKPVEVINQNNNGVEYHKKPRVLDQLNDKKQQPLLVFNDETGLTSFSSSTTNRDLGLMMENEQRWQQMIEAEIGFANEGSSIYGYNAAFNQDYIDQQQLNYSSFHAPEIDPPIGFIDPWSVDNLNSIANNVNESTFEESFSPPSEMVNVEMRDGVNFYDEGSKWLSSDFKAFGPGGPLAEALCTNPASPHDSVSGPATTVSSPSGVLHRTMFSNSDSSVCNSPSEVAFQYFQWLK